jgi:hypothetical protein
MLQRGGGHERVRAGAADGWGRAAARERGWRGTSAGVRGWDAWAASGGRGVQARGRERERGGKLGPDTAQPRGGRKGFSFFSFSISFLFSFP